MTDERIVPSFWLSEFLKSQTAVRYGIENWPKATEMANIRNILAPGMQRVRECLGAPVHISSGFRILELNRKIGSSDTSQHVDGLAADFTSPQFGSPLAICKCLVAHRGDIGYDQLIFEGEWVHVSFPSIGKKARDQVLTAHFNGGKTTYTVGLP